MKICLAASAGGHLTELLKIAACWEGHDTYCVTTTDVVGNQVAEYGDVFVVGECNHQHPLLILKVLFKCILISIRRKPDVVISTGAASGCIMCFLGKLTGAKVVWLDSITNVSKLSLSGRMVRHIADLFLTQWPHLAAKHKNVEYVGEVI